MDSGTRPSSHPALRAKIQALTQRLRRWKEEQQRDSRIGLQSRPVHGSIARAPTSLCFLELLPQEILDIIVSGCCLTLADRARLARTSKTLLHSARAGLYKDVNLSHIHYASPRFPYFFRAIVENPTLGAHVHRLRMRIYEPIGFPCMRRRHLPPTLEGITDLSLLVAYLRTTYGFEPHGTFWEIGLQRADLSALTTILLLHLPNVQAVALDEAYLRDTQYISAIVDASGAVSRYRDELPPAPLPALISPPLLFHQLTSIEIFSSIYRSGFQGSETTALCYFLQHPTLQKIDGTIPDEYILSNPSYTPLRRLTDIRCQRLNLWALEKLLAPISDLRSLKYEPWPPRTWADTEFLCCDLLSSILGRFKHSLTHLTLFNGSTSIPIFGTFRSLYDFEQVQELSIPWILLTKWSHVVSAPSSSSSSSPSSHTYPPGLKGILPRNIRHLTITDWLLEQSNVDVKLAYLERDALFREYLCESEPGALSLASIRVQGAWNYSNKYSKGQIEKYCEEAGIEFVWDSLWSKGATPRGGGVGRLI